jgi:hypothetical protein
MSASMMVLPSDHPRRLQGSTNLRHVQTQRKAAGAAGNVDLVAGIHPGTPSHLHPLGADNETRFFITPISLEDAFWGFQQLIADQIRRGFAPRPREVAVADVPIGSDRSA